VVAPVVATPLDLGPVKYIATAVFNTSLQYVLDEIVVVELIFIGLFPYRDAELFVVLNGVVPDRIEAGTRTELNPAEPIRTSGVVP